MFVCCECCVLSGRGLCDELITRPEESYRLWCVVVCDLETSRVRKPLSALGRSATKKKYPMCIITRSFLMFKQPGVVNTKVSYKTNLNYTQQHQLILHTLNP